MPYLTKSWIQVGSKIVRDGQTEILAHSIKWMVVSPPTIVLSGQHHYGLLLHSIAIVYTSINYCYNTKH